MNDPIAVEALVENLTVRQRDDEGYRRWFVNSYFELIVWYDQKGGSLYGFQLCLSRNHFERAFTWTKEYTSTHHVSESLIEQGYSNQSTGILKGDGKAVSSEELEKFQRDSASLEPDLRRLVVEKIQDYNRRAAN